PMPPTTATALTSWAKAIRRALDAAGQDSARLFAEAGLDATLLDDPAARYPVAATTKLWRLAVDATGDDAFGLTVARHVGQTTFHALGYALNASATLFEAFERVLRYFTVVSDVAELGFDETPEGWRFAIRTDATAVPADESIDAFLALMVRLCRGLLGRREFAPRLLRLRRGEPRNRAAFDRLFRAPLQFSAPENAIYLDSAVLREPLDGAPPELARHDDEIVQRHRQRLQQDAIVARAPGARTGM